MQVLYRKKDYLKWLIITENQNWYSSAVSNDATEAKYAITCRKRVPPRLDIFSGWYNRFDESFIIMLSSLGETIPVNYFFWEQLSILCRWNEFSSSPTDMLGTNGDWFPKQWTQNTCTTPGNVIDFNSLKSPLPGFLSRSKKSDCFLHGYVCACMSLVSLMAVYCYCQMC